jgi:F420-dependent oxidoreductase-like protein
MLEAWLEFHRTTLLLKCEGLDADERKARPIPSSKLSLHGLVRHMAEVERAWFRQRMEQEDVGRIWEDPVDPDVELAPLDRADWNEDLATWRSECDISRAIAARHDLDDTGNKDGQPVSLRWIYVHMIEEYARHNGHADLIRELVDGAVAGERRHPCERGASVKAGIHFVNFTLSGGPQSIAPTLTDTARIAEEAGVASFTLMDHYFQMEGFATAQDPMLEGYTALGFLAGRTQSMMLSLLVTGTTYRHPGLLAKIVTTLDVLSGGRSQLGIGAAWYEREHMGLGVPFPPVAERFERLEETIRICLQMWSDDDGPFEGRHYRLAETICSPQPIRRPRPPILIGGSGERKTLRLVARYADACNLFLHSPDEAAHKLRVLDDHCAAEGRDPKEVTRTGLFIGNVADDPDGFLRQMEAFAALGITLVDLVPLGDPVRFVTEVADKVVPRLAELGS